MALPSPDIRTAPSPVVGLTQSLVIHDADAENFPELAASSRLAAHPPGAERR